MLRMNRANLTRQYTKLGELENAEVYFKLLEKDFPDYKTPGNTQAVAVATWSKAVFFAGKMCWHEANECFENSLNLVKTTLERIPLEAWIEEDYAKALDRQERRVEARVFHEKAHGLSLKYEEIERRIAKNNLQVYCIAKDKEVELGRPFKVRLNVINISKSPAVLIQVEGMIQPESKLISSPSDCCLKKETLLFEKRQVDPFQVENLMFTFQTTKTGVLSLKPRIIYLNAFGEQIFLSKCANLTIKQSSTMNEETVIQDANQPAIVVREQIKCEFKTAASSKTFEFLVTSFISDYMHQRMPSEKSGWRTLTEIINGAKIPKFSVYGANRSKGRTLLLSWKDEE